MLKQPIVSTGSSSMEFFCLLATTCIALLAATTTTGASDVTLTFPDSGSKNKLDPAKRTGKSSNSGMGVNRGSVTAATKIQQKTASIIE